MDDIVLQAIRKSHCDRKGMEHACVGTCSITPSGVRLECDLCGSCDDVKTSLQSDAAEAIRHIFSVAGIRFDCLSIENRVAAINELRKWRA